MERANMNMLLREQPISMLIVDDSEDDAFLLYSELASRGARVDFKRVDTAPEMSDALGEDWDLIICDHSMPGFDALRRWRSSSTAARTSPSSFIPATSATRRLSRPWAKALTTISRRAISRD